MTPPADGGFPDLDLDEASARIEDIAREAYKRFLELVDQGIAPRDAISQVQATFDREYYQELADAFSKVLAEPWTAREMRDYLVGEVRLSNRLYEHWRLTSAEIAGIIRAHAQGVQQARELALALYEGYGFRGVEPLRVLTGNFRTLPAELRALATEPAVRATILQAARRAAQSQLRTAALRSAYTQAFDAAIGGASRARLEKLLRVAVEEKSRYFANRIAQTELARAFSHRAAAELMADATIDVVQWRMSGAHPRADVCDLFANVDRFGLGPGCYPKRLAPKPLAHPFCRCRLRSRPDLRAASAVERPSAEREYLAAMGEERAARLLGSKDRLRQVMVGRPVRDVWNSSLDSQYRVRLLQEAVPTTGAGGVLPAVETPPPVPQAPPVVVPPPQAAAVFEAQTTPTKAAAWAMQHDLADFADYAGVHVSVANAWNRALFEHLQEFPQLRAAQKYTGTAQGQFARFVAIRRTEYANRLIGLGYPREEAGRLAAQRVKSKRVDPKVYAHSWLQPEVSGIAVNTKYGRDPAAFAASLQGDVARQFHPIGCDTIRSVVDHELGHQLDALLGLRRDPEVIQLYDQARARTIENEVSRYAGKSIEEFIAESWSEAKNNPSPRPVARRLAEIVRARHRARFPAAGP